MMYVMGREMMGYWTVVRENTAATSTYYARRVKSVF